MKNTIISFCLMVGMHLISFASEPYQGDKCIIKSEFIYQKGDVSFPSCHASTIIEKHNGLIAAWFGGTEERKPDVGIWLSHYTGGRWTKPVEVANGVQHKSKRYPCWNPVLFNAGSEILLFFKTGSSPSKWWGELMTSNDEGQTWSHPVRLPEDIYGPIKNKPILIKNNVLLCPSSTEDEGWRVHMEFTPDNGLTWERTPALNDRKTGVIQPTILQHRNGRLQMLCRSTVSYIMSSYSDDNGHTWSELTSTGLPNPNSGIDAVTLNDGRFLLVYNHIFKGRNILNIAVSDDGIEWKAAALAENEPGGSEFSYPAVMQTSDGLVHITYTWNRELIKHLVIDPGLIEARPIVNGAWPEK
jgi:predicted neuraminidase